MLSLYFMLRILACVFIVLIFIFICGVLVFESAWSLLFLSLSMMCFLLSASALIIQNVKYEKQAVVDRLHLKDADEIESMDSIGRGKKIYEVKTKEGSYHVTFKEGAQMPTISKVEKLEIKELSH
ncbi:hypothetical protein P4T70_25675 [Bacillus mobilis]|uniref:hypothetical protein n=1 Tax=Bacillus mobilis TaxID=2026190 RepID=UPI002E1C8AE6|nr:hypothetical protein [Bacillus mobilis]